MDSLFVALTSGIDVIKGLFARARAPTYKTMTLVRIVTDEVNFEMSRLSFGISYFWA